MLSRYKEVLVFYRNYISTYSVGPFSFKKRWAHFASEWSGQWSRSRVSAGDERRERDLSRALILSHRYYVTLCEAERKARTKVLSRGTGSNHIDLNISTGPIRSCVLDLNDDRGYLGTFASI
mgnify:CR=1 FL=1